MWLWVLVAVVLIVVAVVTTLLLRRSKAEAIEAAEENPQGIADTELRMDEGGGFGATRP